MPSTRSRSGAGGDQPQGKNSPPCSPARKKQAVHTAETSSGASAKSSLEVFGLLSSPVSAEMGSGPAVEGDRTVLSVPPAKDQQHNEVATKEQNPGKNGHEAVTEGDQLQAEMGAEEDNDVLQFPPAAAPGAEPSLMPCFVPEQGSNLPLLKKPVRVLRLERRCVYQIVIDSVLWPISVFYGLCQDCQCACGGHFS